MSTVIEKRQKFIRYYRRVTGNQEVDMREVAKMAHKMGWTLPKPKDPFELFAQQFSDAARVETREDKVTKKTYKANLAYTKKLASGKQLWLWFDVDEANRQQMVKGLHLYREQMVGEAVIGVNTAEHWSRINPQQAKLPFDTNLTNDVNERMSAAELEEEPKKKMG
jgi:hypothetical protein